MRSFPLAGLACLMLVLTPHAQEPAATDALDGIDPVVLIEQNKEVYGKAEHSAVRGPFRYLFASRESQAAFEADPGKYEIQFGGLCARMGGATGGNPADFLVHDGRIYVFGSDECHRRFAAAPSKYLPPAPAPLPTTSTPRRAGAALLDRAVAALGGRERVAALQTYVETASQVQERPSGKVPVTRVMMWRSNGDVRQERTMALMERRLTIASVLTPGSGWYPREDGGSRPMLEAARTYLRADADRHLIALVRARPGGDTTVAALPSGTVQGQAVEQVRIVRRPLDVTLGIHPVSGEPRTMTFVDRNLEGVFGSYVLVLSDYRTVDGLRLPFEIHAFFDGEPDASRSWTVESIEVNAPLDDALFQPEKSR